jgi:hypothetical protein
MYAKPPGADALLSADSLAGSRQGLVGSGTHVLHLHHDGGRQPSGRVRISVIAV